VFDESGHHDEPIFPGAPHDVRGSSNGLVQSFRPEELGMAFRRKVEASIDGLTEDAEPALTRIREKLDASQLLLVEHLSKIGMARETTLRLRLRPTLSSMSAPATARSGNPVSCNRRIAGRCFPRATPPRPTSPRRKGLRSGSAPLTFYLSFCAQTEVYPKGIEEVSLSTTAHPLQKITPPYHCSMVWFYNFVCPDTGECN